MNNEELDKELLEAVEQDNEVMEELITMSKIQAPLIGQPDPKKRSCHYFILESKLIKRLQRILGVNTTDKLRSHVYGLESAQLDHFNELTDEQLTTEMYTTLNSNEEPKDQVA